MAETFDAYHKWLGIPPDEQPPNHYRLLGIPLFVADDEVISCAGPPTFGPHFGRDMSAFGVEYSVTWLRFLFLVASMLHEVGVVLVGALQCILTSSAESLQ